MIVATFFIVIAALIISALLLTVVVVAWGSLSWRELPPWSEGDEPSTVRTLPRIDLPLDEDDE
jgi:hypothetical protein